MAIRAYKLAEELGIDRSEIVEKATAVGISLASPMASVDDEQAQLLRERLGAPASKAHRVVEQRVQAEGGAVIRRRRKVEAPAPQPPAPVASVAAELERRPAASIELPPPPEPMAELAPPPAVIAELPTAEPVVAKAAERPAAAPAARTGEAERPAKDQEGERPRRTGAAAGADGADRNSRQRKLVREVVNLREQERLAQQAVGRTAARRPVSIEPRSMVSPRRKRRDGVAPAAAPAALRPREEKRQVVRVEGQISVGELARQLGAKAPEVQRRLMALGMMVSIHQAIDLATARNVASEFGFEVQDVGFKEAVFLGPESEQGGNLELRPPVITVMGHVDHGKTSLLDAIRRTDVVAGEAGGITQHTGAYQVERNGHVLTFIDTPGHEAFTAMRARGAQVTDIVVLVVAASEGIMPQTVEAIDHARAAEVPIVVAINKCDLPGANPQQVRQRLMNHNLVPEEFGGEVLCVEVSALKGTNLDKLLETLVLQAEVLELRADPKRRAAGVVLEAHLDRGRGPVATVLVQQGTLRPGDSVVAGTVLGRVRALENESGARVAEAGPSMPVQVFGLSGVPDAGGVFSAVESERVAKQIVDHRQGELRSKLSTPARSRSLEELFAGADGGGPKQLRVVLKADVQGTAEAVRDALTKLSTDEVEVQVIHSGVGGVTESDVMLARASEAIVVGFHVRPDPAARRAADGHGVDVRVYQIIYELTDEVRKAMAGLLPPRLTEQFLGRVEVRKTFTVPRIGMIAGSYVSEGLVRRGGQCRLLRDGVQIYEGKVSSLKRFKDDAREVLAGFECGVGIDGYNDLKVGDIIETFAIEEKPATL